MSTVALSKYDKILRFGICSYPPIRLVNSFFPSFSTYDVGKDNRFSLKDFELALAHYFTGNPFFSECCLQEMVFESPKDFLVKDFQGVLQDKFPAYHASFLVCSVTFESRPDLQGIFTCFPMALMDGFKAFQFSATLMKTLRSGKDEFKMKETISELGLNFEDIGDFLPQTAPPLVSDEDKLENIPFDVWEVETDNVRKYPALIGSVKVDYKRRECENLIFLKNYFYQNNLTIGNYLQFLVIPGSVVNSSDGKGIRDATQSQAAEIDGFIEEQLKTPADIKKAGSQCIPNMMKLDARYFVNNYGAIVNENMVNYQWHMPAMVLGLMSGVFWTITVNGVAHHYTTNEALAKELE